MNAKLKLNLDRLTGTFDVDPSSSRIYSRDAAIDLIVHGFDEGEVTPANEGDATPPGKPVVQFVNSAGRVVAQAMLARPTGEGAGSAGADGKYDLVATLSTNTVEMRREFFGAGPQAVREFTVRILDTETANPIACGPFPVWNFPGVCGDAPTELPSASEVLAELRRMIEEHADRTDNPHAVTAALIEALTQVQADARYALKSSVTSLSSQVSQALNQSAMADAAARGHAARSDNPHGVTAAQVGLGNVDNTADADKPVSARQQTAIAAAKEQVANLVQAEARRAVGREQELQNGIDAERERAASAETDLGRAIRTEKERAQGAEAALGSAKQNKLSSQQLAAVNSGIDADKVAKIAQNESAISSEVSRATTEEARLQTLINAIKTFDVVVADSLPSPSEQYGKKLYLVPSTNPETRNVKDEFICVKIDDVWKWEQIGSTAITIEFDNEPTEGSQKAVRSGGIWSWVKSLLPHWLTSDYAEPATVASVATKADKTALDDKRDKDDLAVYEKVGVGEWTFSVTPSLREGERVEISYQVSEWSIQFLDEDGHDIGHNSVAGKETDFSIATTPVDLIRPDGIENASFTATRAYKVLPVDSLAKVSQLTDKIGKDGGTVGYIGDDYSKVFSGLDLLKFVDDFSGEGKTLREILSGFIRTGNELEYVNDTKYGDLSVVGKIYTPVWSSLISGDGRSLPVYLDSLAWRTTGNRTLSDYGITNAAPLSMISETDPTFSNAVLAVGLNIDTNSVAVLNEIAATFGGFPLGAGETATTVGGLLAALAAAAAWLKKNKVGSFASVGGASATVENGVAKLDDFFTESNSLLTATIDARLPYPLYAVTDETGLLKDRAINTTSLASVTVPDNFTDLLIRASVTSSLAVTMPESIATKYGDTFPGEAGEYLITITKTGAAEAYVRTIKLEVANA